MKNLKFILFTLVLSVFIVSCEDDGGTSFIELNDGVVPNMTKSATTDGFFNLINLNNGENVTIGFSADIAQGSAASTDIVAVYKTAAGPVYSTTLFSDVTLPQDFSLSISDIVAAFSEISTSGDIVVGDVITISARFTMDDGTVLNIVNDDGTSGVGANIQTTGLFTTVLSYPVSCPSDLGGNYSVISNGENTDGQPAAVNLAYDVTITDLGGGSYEISDFSGGVYVFWYNIYGLTWEQPGVFTDVCGSLSGTFGDAWGQAVPATGSVSPDGTISIHWDNPWGDFGDSVFTPQ